MGTLLMATAFVMAASTEPKQEPKQMPVIPKEYAMKAEEINAPKIYWQKAA